MIIDRRLPSFLNHLKGSSMSSPITKPITTAPSISTTGLSSAIPSDSLLPPSAPAMATQMPKNISAVASSIATTLNSVSVIGPLALYWRMTIIVAAGAVAAAMEPSTIENGRSKPAMMSPTITKTTASSDSNTAITIGVAPTRLKYEILNSLPIEKAMKPSATFDIIVIELIASAGIMLSTLGPIIRPPTR